VSSIRNAKNVLGLLEPYDPGLFPEDITERYGIPPNQIVNLSSNENPYPPPERLIQRIAEELSGANRYPNPSYKQLKRSLCEYVDLPTDHIAVGNGSSDLIDLACKIFLTPLDKVVIPVPTYALYMLTSMIWEASITYVDTENTDFVLGAAKVEPFLNGTRLVLLGSPNNPTGMRVSNQELSKMLDSEDTVFVVDEAYYEFCGKTAAELLKNHDNLIVIRSMSKYFCLAGLRVGYALANPELIESLEKTRLPFTINSLAQTAAIQALENLDYFREIAKQIVSEKSRLADELQRIGLRPLPSDANFIMVRLLRGLDSNEFVQELASKGVIVRSLEGLVGLSGEFFRVTVGTREENEKFIQTCEVILSR